MVDFAGALVFVGVIAEVVATVFEPRAGVPTAGPVRLAALVAGDEADAIARPATAGTGGRRGATAVVASFPLIVAPLIATGGSAVPVAVAIPTVGAVGAVGAVLRVLDRDGVEADRQRECPLRLGGGGRARSDPRGEEEGERLHVGA